MITRQELEAREEKILSPYAAKAGRSRGRKHAEPEHPYRTAFQRDRDRVIHCTAFRRLEYKTQVFVNQEGDYYRTRLTHSMETAQVARTLARALSLNEDLCEVLALAHDLGHPPFGHAGQDALHDCMKKHGGFEHNLQSLRIIELLEERYPGFVGLNLTFETRESMRKHTVRPDMPVEKELQPGWAPLLEAQIVDNADSIAYASHDLDDGVKAGLITESQLLEVPLYRRAADRVKQGVKGAPDEIRQRAAVRSILDLMVTDLIESTESNLGKQNVSSINDVRRAKKPLVVYSPGMAREKLQFQRFLYDNVYRHHRVVVMSEKAMRFVKALFQAYAANIEQLPPRFRKWAKTVGLERAVADYIAGMTDRYAQDEYRKLFHPFENIL